MKKFAPLKNKTKNKKRAMKSASNAKIVRKTKQTKFK